jgi:hypothetical protein
MGHTDTRRTCRSMALTVGPSSGKGAAFSSQKLVANRDHILLMRQSKEA